MAKLHAARARCTLGAASPSVSTDLRSGTLCGCGPDSGCEVASSGAETALGAVAAVAVQLEVRLWLEAGSADKETFIAQWRRRLRAGSVPRREGADRLRVAKTGDGVGLTVIHESCGSRTRRGVGKVVGASRLTPYDAKGRLRLRHERHGRNVTNATSGTSCTNEAASRTIRTIRTIRTNETSCQG